MFWPKPSRSPAAEEPSVDTAAAQSTARPRVWLRPGRPETTLRRSSAFTPNLGFSCRPSACAKGLRPRCVWAWGAAKTGGRGRWHRGGPSSPGGNAPSSRNKSWSPFLRWNFRGHASGQWAWSTVRGFSKRHRTSFWPPQQAWRPPGTPRPVPSTAQQLFVGQCAHPRSKPF